ncbi:flavodoxin domain-containing protein [Georgenia faecalis]|uniref:Flavodoxin domain-containing protein n=1 Tax=Georgenia faecalis TaxID=2483799 RepID=A0ABV9DCC7_9MICO|nr:flavodoxin domain-containing protein [Georgenia faecalis]
MRILVVSASKHEATAEIADAIAQELAALGHTTRHEPAQSADIGDAEVVVLGSAVYMSRWMAHAREFAERHAGELAVLPTWVFSVGLAGAEADEPTTVEPKVVAAVDPVGTATFPGRIEPELLNLRERSVTRLVRAPQGDLRDWDAVRAFARRIDAECTEHLAPGESR